MEIPDILVFILSFGSGAIVGFYMLYREIKKEADRMGFDVKLSFGKRK